VNSVGVPEIAGNTALLSELRLMKTGAHLPHALLLHGPAGCGKKLIAKWFSMLVLCESRSDAPCGTCKSCRLIAEDAHPDVLYAEHSGKRGGFSVETVREIRSEAAILPNNGEMRMFLFTDADGMSIQAQNALLKSVEEPPAHACFVFTAETVGALLPTLLSRMTAMAVGPVTPAECAGVLNARGYSADEAQPAVSRFGGNVGKCLSYLSDDAMRQAVQTAAALTDAAARQNEYEMLRLLTAAASDKDGLRQTLSLFDLQIRDAAVCALEGELPRLGCDAAAAKALAARYSPRRLMKMHGAVTEAFADLDGNVGAVLTVTALTAALTDC
jgi:DNA polymerase-3 subunit delta'